MKADVLVEADGAVIDRADSEVHRRNPSVAHARQQRLDQTATVAGALPDRQDIDMQMRRVLSKRRVVRMPAMNLSDAAGVG